MRLYLIRHGRQANQLCNSNVELAPEGRRQAQLLGKRLAAYEIGALYSSDLVRAVETAEIANESLHVEHRIIPQLREICFGDLENRSDEENAVDFADFLRENRKMERDLAYPNGECGEDVYRRGLPALYQIIKECGAEGIENAAVVTHGVFIRSMLAGLFGRDFAVKSRFGRCMENGSITELLYQEEYDRFCLERFNDYAHLETEPELLRKAWNKAKL